MENSTTAGQSTSDITSQKKWNTFECVSLVQYSSRVQLCWVQTIQNSRGVQFSIVNCEHRKKMKHFWIHQANKVFYRHTLHCLVVYHKNEPMYRVSLVIMLVVAMNTSTVPWWLRHAMLQKCFQLLIVRALECNLLGECRSILYSAPAADAELINRRGEGREKKKNSKEFNFLKNILAQKRKNFKKKIYRSFIRENKIRKFC